MKSIKYMFITVLIFCWAEKVLAQETLRGSIQYKSAAGVNSLTAVVMLPVPEEGRPYQVKAVFTRKISQGNEKNEQRFLFLRQGDVLKSGVFFTIQEGVITADLGKVDPLKEQLSVFLVYKGTGENGKVSFSQKKAELN